MRIDVHIHTEGSLDSQKLDTILAMLHALKIKEDSMAASLDALTAQVAKNTDVTQSALVLIQGLKAALDAAGTDPVALAALSAQLQTSDDALAAAVAANTPAQP